MVAVLLMAATFPLHIPAAEVTVTWTFATLNVDGTRLTDLAGAKVYYGTASSNYTHVLEVPGGQPGQTVACIVTGLVAEATYYLNGTAYNTSGLESDFCTEAVKVARVRRIAGADGFILPDSWVRLYFDDFLSNSIAADEDYDGDGMTNGDEYVAGTDPTDAGDAPAVDARIEDGIPRLRFATKDVSAPFYVDKVRTYTIEITHDLKAGSWTSLQGWERFVATNSAMEVVLPREVLTPSFYRIRVHLE